MFPERVSSFVARAHSLASLGGWPNAIQSLIRMKWKPTAINFVTYKGNLVKYRRQDLQAVLEVLIDREYSFLAGTLMAENSPTVLDVGAHIGTFALWALGVNPRARIVSVEPDPQTCEILEDNQKPKIAKGQKWKVMCVAAGDRDGAKMPFSNQGPSMSHRVDAHGDLEVRSVSLETLLNQFSNGKSRIDLVKVDIEGSEERFLAAKPDLLINVNNLALELHPYLCDTNRLRKLLAKHFTIVESIRGRNSSKPLLFCRR